MKILFCLLCILVAGCTTVPTNNNNATGTKIYSTDSFGNIQYHKPSLIIIKDRIYEVDKFGTILYHKPQKKIAQK